MQRRFPNVLDYRFSKKGEMLAFSTSADKPESDGVFVFDLKKQTQTQIISGLGNYGVPVINETATHVSFLTDRDDYQAEQPSWSIYLWRTKQKSATKIAHHDTAGIPKGWWISSSSAPRFTEDSRRIFFNTRPIPEDRNKKKETQEEKKAVLDIWHWQDPALQPEQLLRVQRDKNRSYEALYDVKSKKIFQIEDKKVSSVSINLRSTADVAVGRSTEKYDKMLSWDRQGYGDLYVVNLINGKRKMIFEKNRGFPSASLTGKYLTWWDAENLKWLALPTSAADSDEPLTPIDLGKGIGYALQNELHDTPSLARPYGIAGWLDNDAGVLIYDNWDIWQVDPEGKTAPVCLTHGEGRKNQIRFRVQRLDSEKLSINPAEPIYLSAFYHKTKATGFQKLTLGENGKLVELMKLNEAIGGMRKAKNSDDVFFTRSTFRRSPDLWASTLEFKKIHRLSKANPQQRDYLWGTAELVNWSAQDGQPLDGILYKPDNFDPKKKYPLMVYFYERNSDNLHRYYSPSAGRSIINFSFYVSRGYLIFVPDIPYKVGEPGPSAVNAIIPGVESIVAKGFVDKKRIGMQGHSWGGYQTAYLVTQTDMFACAESGAPVSNMTSAYGGIRWGTGMSRMFQYEKTQSRIGETLWKAREKYIANSPLFFVDKINTPLLILHNDKDTAVPWYQGIELFVAMRRLEKPSWMLNYNGDPHWVMSMENRMDFAKRMQQFFDHYLKGDPMPVWMSKGIPAVDKGKKFGFEPTPEEKPKADPKSESKSEPKNEK